MYLFLIMTQAQLMNAIVLSKTVLKDAECDAYIISNLERYKSAVENSKVFKNVYSYDLVPDIAGRQNSFKRMLVRIKNAMDVKKIPAMMPSDLNSYDCIFVSGETLRNFEIYYAAKRINPSVRITLYEEGTCEYCNLSEKSKSKKLFSHFFFHSYFFEDCRELYVYEPSVVKSVWDNITVKPIPRFYEDKDLICILNKVFGFNIEETYVYKNKVVFLESCFDANLDFEKYQLDMLNIVIETVGAENVIVKMHPRSPKNKYPENIKTVYSNSPFEILAVNMDLDSCAFVSPYSSAIVTPKLILNKEPVVICLDRILDRELNEGDYVFDRVADIYENKSFYIPKSEAELTDALSKLKCIMK